MNPFSLSDPTKRRYLDVRDKPYFVRVTDSVHLGYKKGKSVSRWVMRCRVDAVYISRTFPGVIPDDTVPPNGKTVLSFDQALLKATTMNIENVSTDYIRRCGFCNEPQTKVKVLIAGPSSYICGKCVDICNNIIENKRTVTSHRLDA